MRTPPMHNLVENDISTLRGCAWLLLLLLMLSPSASQAWPNIRASFFTVYPNVLGSKLDSVPSKAGHCGVCHYDFNGGGSKNPYGPAQMAAESLVPGATRLLGERKAFRGSPGATPA